MPSGAKPNWPERVVPRPGPEVAVRNSLKVLMAVLALVGITGMYLRQVKQSGALGLVGYLLMSTCYLSIMCTSFIGAYVLPSIAGTVFSPAALRRILRRSMLRSAMRFVGSRARAVW